MSRYVMGIDVGTEGVRAGVFDEGGARVGIGLAPIVTTHPHPGWAEQDVADWEAGLAAAVRGALASAEVGADRIEGLAADGTTSTVVLLDEGGRPLRRALLWMDVRAHREAQRVAATGHPALACTAGGAVSAEWFPCKLMWIRRHEPDVFERAALALELTDWLAYRLTGSVTGAISAASMRMLYDDARGGIPRSLYEHIGLTDALDRMPAAYADAGTLAGSLAADAAAVLGLRPGTPVAVGGADAPMGALGMGVAAPGRLALITGSSHVHFTLLDCEVRPAGLFGSYPNGLVRGLHLLEGGQVSTGSVLRWFAEGFVPPRVHDAAARRGQTLIEHLGELAASVSPGADGLLVLDHFQGSRTPWSDPTSRGVIRGLTLGHGPEHVVRAIMESVACGSAVIARRMAGAGVHLEETVMCGGVTRSGIWTQIHADALGTPITIPAEQEASLLGSAMAASVAAGVHPDLRSAAARMARADRVVEPNGANGEAYAFLVERYERTYEALAEDSRRLVAWSESEP
ncbi:MAG: FGGY-family carbohydrate kinase [Spirochaetota bacterium]